MAIPTYEYNAGDSELQCMRDSSAVKEDYADGFSDLVAFEKNTKKVLLSSVIEPFISTEAPTPLRHGIDEFNNRILCVSGSTLSSTTDGVTFDTIVVFANVTSPVGDTIGDFWASLTAPTLTKVVMTSATSAMISMGDLSNNPDPSGKIYKTVDNFATFTEELSITDGSPFNIVKHKTEDWWLSPTYQLVAGGSLNVQRLYAKFNEIDGWVILDTTTYGAISGNAHTHTGRFYGDDTIFVTYGDGIQSRLTKLTRPVAWNGTDPWTKEWEKNVAMTQISDFPEIEGDKIYMRREGMDRSISDVYIYDIINDTFDGKTFLNMKQDVDDGKPYLSKANALEQGNTLLTNGSLFVTVTNSFDADLDNGGLHISNDGKNWAQIYRSTKGIREVTGFYNNQIIVKIYDSGDVLRLGLFPIPSIRAIDAVKVEKGQTNLIGLFDGSVTDNWATSAGDSRDSDIQIYSDADRVYASETGIKITAKDNSYANPGQWTVGTEFSTADLGSFPQRILSPQANDYCVLSYDIKYEGYNADTIASIIRISTSSALAAVGGVGVVETYPISNEWVRVFISWKSSVSDAASKALTITSIIDQGAYAYNADVVVKIQNVNYYFDTERVDLRSYTPKATPRVDDYSIAPLTGLGASWSVTFDWMPLNGNLAYPTGAVTTVPIATIKGSGAEYLELYWDRAAYDGAGGGLAFKLTDGTTTISLDTEQGGVAMAWLHNDILKFGITSDGTDTVLYCFNPENGAIHGSSIISNTDATTNIDSSTSIALGVNEDETIIGTGAFANIRGFDSVLSAGDIADVFDSVETLQGGEDPRGRFSGSTVTGRERFITNGRF